MILAAGLSSRMGAFKPLLEIEGVTLLDRAVRLFSGHDISPIVVVAGYQAESIGQHLSGTKTRVVINEQFREGMFTSIRAGAAVLKDDCPAFFLLPVDIPLVSVGTIDKLLEARAAAESFAIYHPVYEGRKGHPPLLTSGLVESLLAYQGEGGMRGFLRQHSHKARLVEVDDPHIHHDVDTKKELERLQRLIRE